MESRTDSTRKTFSDFGFLYQARLENASNEIFLHFINKIVVDRKRARARERERQRREENYIHLPLNHLMEINQIARYTDCCYKNDIASLGSLRQMRVIRLCSFPSYTFRPLELSVDSTSFGARTVLISFRKPSSYHVNTNVDSFLIRSLCAEISFSCAQIKSISKIVCDVWDLTQGLQLGVRSLRFSLNLPEINEVICRLDF